jgi:RecQ family ATP-dependent DNA helicase
LLEHWGHSTLRPSQREAISHVLAGRDCLVVAPTGAGKSVCFQLPPLLTGKLSVVVTPIVALMQDQVSSATARGIRATFLGSSQRDPSVERRILQGEFDLVYVTPEKLSSGGGAALLARWHAKLGVGLLAVDEAHCVVSWGFDFRPSFLGIGAARPAGVSLMALTATAPPDLRPPLCRSLNMSAHKALVHSALDRPNLEYRVCPKGRCPADSLLPLLHGADSSLAERSSAAIIYVSTTAEADQLGELLCRAGVSAGVYHARAAHKDETLRRFTRDQIRVIVATVALGMGVDKPDVRLLVHWGPPPSPELYYQQSGRAGRDGLFARCVLFHSPADWSRLLMLASSAVDARQREASCRAAGAMRCIAHTHSCRRAAVLAYLGEAIPTAAGVAPASAGWSGSIRCCDNCARGQRSSRDAGAEGRALLRAVGACRGRFGLGTAIELVRGAKTQTLAGKAGGRLVADASFGCGAAFGQPAEWWRALAEAMVEAGLLVKTVVPISGSGYGQRSAFEAIGMSDAAERLLAQGSDAAPAPILLPLDDVRTRPSAQCAGGGGGRGTGRQGGATTAQRGAGAAAACGASADSSVPLAHDVGPPLSAAECSILAELRSLCLGQAPHHDGGALGGGAGSELNGCGALAAGGQGHARAGVEDALSCGTAGDLLSERCLLALARSRPSDAQGLAAVTGLERARLCSRGADTLLQFLARGCELHGLRPNQLSDDQHAVCLVRRLREERARQAVREDVPPYVILGDSQLALIASRTPPDLVALATVPGIPRRAVERHGEMFLRAVAAYCAQYGWRGATSAEPAQPREAREGASIVRCASVPPSPVSPVAAATASACATHVPVPLERPAAAPVSSHATSAPLAPASAPPGGESGWRSIRRPEGTSNAAKGEPRTAKAAAPKRKLPATFFQTRRSR